MPVTIDTDGGLVHGHITGDSDMSEELRGALVEMMRIAANNAMAEAKE